MPALSPLPIDDVLPEIVQAFRENLPVVLEAPPGAGKTTRVPRALLDAGLLDGGEVLVLQPRRLAARLSAHRVASELNETVGMTVGYQVRFEEQVSQHTRIRFITEGILTRRLIRDPLLKGVSTVLLDEFHERHLTSDMSLALVQRLRLSRRPDLRLGVMSATLDGMAVANFLPGARRIVSEGRRFDVAIEHIPTDERPLSAQVAMALNRLLSSPPDKMPSALGDVLVFLPGAAEIRQSMDSCQRLAEQYKRQLFALHGELSAEEQDRAVRPSRERKVIFATNVAETSVTIEGVTAVIDSGLARSAGHNPWSGLPTIGLARISQASAQQRTGRAGRTRPGVCIRLYSQADFNQRPAFDLPELHRLDLAESVLELKAAGVENPFSFGWFEAPPRQALVAAEELLLRLGATTPVPELAAADGEQASRLTPLGRRMLEFPVHPRQARLLLEAESRGVGSDAAWLAALMGEKEIVLEQRVRNLGDSNRNPQRSRLDSMGPSDILARMDLLKSLLPMNGTRAGQDRINQSPERLRQEGLDPGAVMAVDRSRLQLVRLLRLPSQKPGSSRLTVAQEEQALLMSVVAAYPDRVAKRRPTQAKPGNRTTALSRELIFAFGGVATLSESSILLEHETLVALDVESRTDGGLRGAQVRVRLASALEPEWLLDLFPEQIQESIDLRFNTETESVEKVERMAYGNLVIESRKVPLKAGEGSEVLWQAARAAGVERFTPEGALSHWLERLRFVAREQPDSGLTPPTPAELEEVLESLCGGLGSFRELQEANVMSELEQLLSSDARQKLERLAPARLRLGNGRMCKVGYPDGQAPFMSSRLQDFFGLKQGPAVLGGKLPVVLHLLAPNQRAVQVTTDLASFWNTHYPKLRRELSRAYPRHAWPENPLEAEPPPVKGRPQKS